jgi:CHASE2 domain-containing sensor protein
MRVIHRHWQDGLIYLFLFAASLCGAILFMRGNPELFIEMMIIVGPFLAAGVSLAVGVLLSGVCWLALGRRFVYVMAVVTATFTSFVGSAIWAYYHQGYLLELMRMGR